MGFVGIRLNVIEEKQLNELETKLRSFTHLNIKNRTEAVKLALKIASWYLNTGPFFSGDCLTPKQNEETPNPQRPVKSIINGSDIDLDGRPKRAPTKLL